MREYAIKRVKSGFIKAGFYPRDPERRISLGRFKTDALARAAVAQDGGVVIEDPSPRTTPERLARRLAALATTCWTAVVGKGYTDGDETAPEHMASSWHVIFTRQEGDLTARVALMVSAVRKGRFSAYELERAINGNTVEGATLVNGRSFVRRGIDSACVWLQPLKHVAPDSNTYATIGSLLEGEWSRCERAHQRRKTAQPVPGLPYSRQPDWFQTTANELRKGQFVRLLPHGMGVGHVLRMGNPARFETRASRDLERALCVFPIAISTIDCD